MSEVGSKPGQESPCNFRRFGTEGRVFRVWDLGLKSLPAVFVVLALKDECLGFRV